MTGDDLAGNMILRISQAIGTAFSQSIPFCKSVIEGGERRGEVLDLGSPLMGQSIFYFFDLTEVIKTTRGHGR